MLTTADLHGGRLPIRAVHNVIVAHDTAETFILWLVVGVVGEGRLEATLLPVRRGVRRLARRAPH